MKDRKKERKKRRRKYTAECSFFLTASYYAYQYYLGLIRNIGVYMQKKIAVRSGFKLLCKERKKEKE